MKRFAIGWRRALGIAVAGIGTLTATASFAATTLTVWCWDPNFNGVTMREAGDIYAKTHPDVSLNVIDTTSQDDVRTKLQAQLLSGSTDGLPDIVLIEDDVAQKYLQSFPGSFEPLSDSIDMSKFAQYKVAAATFDGKSYSLPFDSGVAGLFYRSDYLAQAGYKADDLQDITWDDLIKIGKDVMAKTGHPMLDIDYNERGLIHMMLQSAGQWYFKEDGSLDILDNAALKAALEQYARIWQSGIVKPVSGWSDFTGGFTSGEVASVPIGVWITGTIKANADQSGKWAVAPIPKLAGVPERRARLQLGRLELVCPGEVAEQGRRHRLPEVGLGQLTSTSTRRSWSIRAPSARCSPRAAATPISSRIRSSAASRSGRTSPTGSARSPRIRLRHLHRRGRLCRGRRSCRRSPRAARSMTPSRRSTIRPRRRFSRQLREREQSRSRARDAAST